MIRRATPNRPVITFSLYHLNWQYGDQTRDQTQGKWHGDWWGGGPATSRSKHMAGMGGNGVRTGTFGGSMTVKRHALTLYQALFNVMLREMGVRGLKVQELYSIDDDMLAFLPYGLDDQS